MIAERSTGSLRSWILPRVIRETSSRSSTSRAMQRTCCSTTSRIVSRSTGSSPRSLMMWTALRIGARGLRSSWASIARNSSLRWSARASSATFCSQLLLQPLAVADVAEARPAAPAPPPTRSRRPASRRRATSASASGRSTSVVPPAMIGMPKYCPTSSEAGRSSSLVAAGLTKRIIAVVADHQDAVGVLLDDVAEPRLARLQRGRRPGLLGGTITRVFHRHTRLTPIDEGAASDSSPAAYLTIHDRTIEPGEVATPCRLREPLLPAIRPRERLRSERPEIQAEQHAFGIREVADDPPDRRRQFLDHHRRRQDLLVLGQLGTLQHVDHHQLVLAVELAVADAPEVLDGPERARCLTGDVELDRVFHRGRSLVRPVGAPCPGTSRLVRLPCPMHAIGLPLGSSPTSVTSAVAPIR